MDLETQPLLVEPSAERVRIEQGGCGGGASWTVKPWSLLMSELLHPPADPLGGGAPAVGAGASPGASSRQRTDGDAAPFAVDWQVRPSLREARPAELGTGFKVPVPAGGLDFTFGVARALGTVVVTARGMIDEVGARTLVHALGDLIENQGNMTVVVDLHDVTDVDPRCLDIFVTAHNWALIRGGHLSLTGVRLRVARALVDTGVDHLVKVTSDRILAVPAACSD